MPRFHSSSVLHTFGRVSFVFAVVAVAYAGLQSRRRRNSVDVQVAGAAPYTPTPETRPASTETPEVALALEPPMTEERAVSVAGPASEPVVESKPVAEPEPVVEPESVVEREPVVEFEPVVEPESVVEREPVVESQSAAASEMVVAEEHSSWTSPEFAETEPERSETGPEPEPELSEPEPEPQSAPSPLPWWNDEVTSRPA